MKPLRVLLADSNHSLTNEIKAYEAYMRLSPREKAASELVISDVNSVAQNELKIRTLSLLGSRSTGLATPTSDFDFSFTQPVSLPGGWIIPSSEDSVSQPQSYRREIKPKAVKALKKMRRHFNSSNKFCNTELVEYAHVPILRSTHVATGLDVQIQTMARYQASREQTIAYLLEFPSLRPLYITLRYCLEIRNLTTVFDGGLGSYTILMMIVTALKHSRGKFAPNDLGGQLLHVLDFYSDADLYKVGFSANPPRIFEKQKERVSLAAREAHLDDPQLNGIDKMQTFYPRKPYLLCLQDPANDLNDLGKNAYAIKHVQATFYNAQKKFRNALKRDTKLKKGKIPTPLDHLVRADYRAFEVRRSRVERCADPTKSDDLDYSEQRIRRDYERRVNSDKVDVEEHDNLRPVRTPHRKVRGRIRLRLIPRPGPGPRPRLRLEEAIKRVIAARKQVEIQKLLGTNRDDPGANSPESRRPLASSSVRKHPVKSTHRYAIDERPLVQSIRRYPPQKSAARPSRPADDEGPPGLVRNVTVNKHPVPEHWWSRLRMNKRKENLLAWAKGRARAKAKARTTAPVKKKKTYPSLYVIARPSYLLRYAVQGRGRGGRRRAVRTAHRRDVGV